LPVAHFAAASARFRDSLLDAARLRTDLENAACLSARFITPLSDALGADFPALAAHHFSACHRAAQTNAILASASLIGEKGESGRLLLRQSPALNCVKSYVVH
jgi:hypothetical protein